MSALHPIDPTRTVAEVVAAHPPTARLFAERRIDFCCKGGVTIAAAAAARGLDPAALCAELAVVVDEAPAGHDPRGLSTPDLVARIVATHHTLLRDLLPWVGTLASKVARVHGDHDPRLAEVDRVVRDLSALLLGHLDEEERALFPALLSASGARSSSGARHVDGAAGAEGAPATPPAEVARLLDAMRSDHDQVAAHLERLRLLTDDLTPPVWACRSYQALLAELARVEADVHVHVHLENHVLAGRFGR